MHIYLDYLIHTYRSLNLILKKNKAQNKPAIKSSHLRCYSWNLSECHRSMRMLRSRWRLRFKTNSFFFFFLVRLLTHLCHAPHAVLMHHAPWSQRFTLSVLTLSTYCKWYTSLGYMPPWRTYFASWQYQNKTSHTSAKSALHQSACALDSLISQRPTCT